MVRLLLFPVFRRMGNRLLQKVVIAHGQRVKFSEILLNVKKNLQILIKK